MRSARRHSASLRLALGLSSLLTLFALSAMALQYRATAHELRDRERALLAAEAQALGALYQQRRVIALREAMEYRAFSGTGDGALYLLLGKEGERLAGNLEAWPAMLPALSGPIDASAPIPFRHAGGPYLGITRLLPGGFALLLARPMQGTEAALAAARTRIAALAAGLAALSLLAGWGISRLVMGRIDRLNGLADRVAAGEIDARLPGPRRPDEFGLLESHIHAMLERIGHLTRATHRLSDSIAHELRTPLARIQQRLDSLPETAETEAARSEIRATIRIFESLLDISAAEAATGSSPGLRPVDLSALATELAELYGALAEEEGLVLETRIAPGAEVLGDRTLIAQAAGNLLDNAIKFCRPGDAMCVQVAEEGGRHVLWVRDSGPGLPEGLEDPFAPFARAERDASRPGHGLGLALVRAIAARHGARLLCPATRKGLQIGLAFPKLPKTDATRPAP